MLHFSKTPAERCRQHTCVTLHQRPVRLLKAASGKSALVVNPKGVLVMRKAGVNRLPACQVT